MKAFGWLLLATCIANYGLAQSTVFTYQGRLDNGTNPASGLYDLQFSLYDSQNGGNLIAWPLTNSETVSNGLFTTRLDFNGAAAKWLQISVRTNGEDAFTTLVPRQELTSTPYAITAEKVISGGIATGTYGNAVAFNNTANQFAGAFTGSGAGLTNVPGGFATPEMFGAKGDGATDDTAAIQSFLYYAGELFVPDGVYSVSNLFLTNNTHLRFSSDARFVLNPSATNWTLATGNNTNIQLENVVLDGGGRTTPGSLGSRHGLQMNLGTNGNSWVKYCEFIGFNGTGIQGTEPGGVLSGQLYKVGSVDHVSAKFCGRGIYQPELGSDSAEYTQWSECSAISCFEGFEKTAGNVINTGHRISNNTTGIRIIGPGSNGNHSLWSSCIVNHNTTFVYASGVATGEEFSSSILIAGGAIILNNCNGVTFNGCQLSGPAPIIVTNSIAGAQNGFIANKFQGDWPLQKSVQTNDGGAFFFGNWCWNQGGITNSSDGSFGNPPFIIKALRYPLNTASTTGTYNGANDSPSPYFDRDWISWAASNAGGIGAYFPAQNTSPSTNSICTVTILNTNSTPLWLTNFHAVTMYFANDGRKYLNPTFLSVTNLAQGYTSISWTNNYTNSTLTKAIGFEIGQGNITQNAYITKFLEQPLQ